MSARNDVFLGVAAALAGAAYLFAGSDTAEAAAASGSAPVNPQTGTPAPTPGGSSNGFAINNPLNIRYLATNAFNGQTGNHNGYGVYVDLAHGVRAAGKQLTNYINRGLNTLTLIIGTWAPSTENITSAYIADVSQRTDIEANEVLSWPQDEVNLIQAMAWHENGYNNMADEDVQTWINT